MLMCSCGTARKPLSGDKCLTCVLSMPSWDNSDARVARLHAKDVDDSREEIIRYSREARVVIGFDHCWPLEQRRHPDSSLGKGTFASS